MRFLGIELVFLPLQGYSNVLTTRPTLHWLIMSISVKGNRSFIFSSKTNHLSLLYIYINLVLEAHHAYEFYYNNFFLFVVFFIPTLSVKLLFNFII